MTAKYQDPVVNERGHKTHPAFGQIRVNRVSGDATLYGSEFKHQHFICLTVSKSEEERHLCREWRYEKNTVCEVWMSEAQWAGFVSSFGIGSGVPCTIRCDGKEWLPLIPTQPTASDDFKKEVMEDMKEALEKIKSLESQIEALSISQKKKDELKKSAKSVASSINSSVPFVASSFSEYMENTVAKAKSEVDAYAMNHLLTKAGFEIPMLEHNKGEE